MCKGGEAARLHIVQLELGRVGEAGQLGLVLLEQRRVARRQVAREPDAVLGAGGELLEFGPGDGRSRGSGHEGAVAVELARREP